MVQFFTLEHNKQLILNEDAFIFSQVISQNLVKIMIFVYHLNGYQIWGQNLYWVNANGRFLSS